MVRGLDYYTKTTFEFVHDGLGAQSGIGGGGRYDGLMALLGGQPLTGVGYGIGVDRTLLACRVEGVAPWSTARCEVFGVPLGDAARRRLVVLAAALRRAGVRVDLAYGGRGLKGAMKAADRSGARFALVLGERDLEAGQVGLKDLATGEQTAVALDDAVEAVARRRSADRSPGRPAGVARRHGWCSGAARRSLIVRTRVLDRDPVPPVRRARGRTAMPGPSSPCPSHALTGECRLRADRHRARRLHGHAGPAPGQADPRPVLPGRGGRPRHGGLQLPARGGRRDEHRERLRDLVVGAGLRRLPDHAGPDHAAARAVASRRRPWSSATSRGWTAPRSASRRGRCCGPRPTRRNGSGSPPTGPRSWSSSSSPTPSSRRSTRTTTG